MEKFYPKYPIDFYRLRVPFYGSDREEAMPPKIAFDAVRENPFGSAFSRQNERKESSARFS